MQEKNDSRGAGKIIMKNPFLDREESMEDRTSDVIFIPIKKQLPLKPHEK